MEERARDLAAFIDARSGSLLRFAYLLTGDHGLAQDLLQDSLIKVYLSWDRIRDRAALEAFTRTVMTRTQLSWWRRPARREVLGVEPTERAVRDQHHVHERDRVDERDELWALLATLARGRERFSSFGSTRISARPRSRACSAARLGP